ncbi:MAG: DUF4956 domain-containing protein [Flavobacteriales bacterium]|nr:DUF4956 domain-containing protein [Flavobacteriales bacterium]MCB9448376.1 DUF4956 domain-containing protein [Flavobacteriales bacterium]
MLLVELLNEDNTREAFTLFNKLSEKFFVRLAVDFASVFVLVRLIYYPIYRNREYFFTFFIFNLIIFLITYLLNKVDMSMGAAFGLFAVFSMLRYRTEGISMKDMTYLFLVIAIGLLTAVTKGSADEFILLNAIIIGVTYLLESNILIKKEASKVIQYENIDMIKPEHREELIKDLEQRTGLKINRITLHRVDFLRDTAVIRIYYYEV